MRFLLKIGLLSLAILLSTGTSLGQIHVDSSCLVLWQNSPMKPHNVVWDNDDSVMVDLCDPYGVTNYEYPEFAKKKFWIHFQYYIIPDTLAPIGDSTEHDWQKLNAKYFNLRNAFDSLEKIFGAFTIHHRAEENFGLAVGDTLHALKNWEVDFTSYQNIDSVLYYLKKMPYVYIIGNTIADVVFGGYPQFYERVINPGEYDFYFWPQPCKKELFIHSDQPIKKIIVCDQLGRREEAPINFVSDNQYFLDVSQMPEGFYFLNISGHFFKVLIQK